MRTQIIAIAGGSGSGKTTFARMVLKSLGTERVGLMAQDSYYIDQSHRFDKDGGSVNFDHPSALDFELMAHHLRELRAHRPVKVPIYDFATHKRLPATQPLDPHPYILVDGTLILAQAVLRPLFDESIFIDVDAATRFARRLKRDVSERGRTPEGVKEQFERQVGPMHDQFVAPSMAFASFKVGVDDFESRLSEFLRHLKA
jgi:uridine kinase